MRRVSRRLRRPALATAAILLGGFALAILARPGVERGAASGDTPPRAAKASESSPLVEQGRRLFVEGCSSCHGFDGRGVAGSGPSLVGAGAESADFYLRTGRMPLDEVGDQPLRGDPHYPEPEIRALVAYAGSLGGPPIPDVSPERGSLAEGFDLFDASCGGCHAITGRGGVAIGAYAPPLTDSTPTQVGEAIRIGPYLMPAFSRGQISDSQVDSIARYVELTKHPRDEGGWGIGHIGPVPEGAIAWLAALAALLIIARLIGERTDERGDEAG